MVSLVLLALAVSPPPLATVDGEPITQAEVRRFLEAQAGRFPAPWPSMPAAEREKLAPARATLAPLIELHLAARAAKERKLALSAAELAKLPKVDRKTTDDDSFFVRGAPKGVPRDETQRAMLERALLVERYVRSLVPSEDPTEDDFTAALAAHPELKRTEPELLLRCFPPPTKDRARLKELVAQKKPLDEVAKALGITHFVQMRFTAAVEEDRASFEQLRTGPDNVAVTLPLGATCTRVSFSPARDRTKAELRDALTRFASDLAEERAWRLVIAPLLEKAKVTVDEKALEALQRSVDEAPR